MARIKIQTAYLPVEIELWGNVYETVDLTSDESDQETDLYAEALTTDEESKSVDYFGKVLDLILRPIEGSKKPSTSLKAEHKAKRITARQCVGVVAQIKAAEQGESNKLLQRLAAGRPT